LKNWRNGFKGKNMSKLIGGRHVGIPVSNMEEMKNFYTNTIGFLIKTDEIEEGDFISSISNISNTRVHILKMVAPDGWMIELLYYLSSDDYVTLNKQRKISDIGNNHIAITISNLDLFYKELLSKGIIFLSAPFISPSGKAKVCFCRDPDGNLVELVEVRN
jgi:catechol 2,3-dioxygenase-like lactoylglutathione lyase family enzyme